MPANFSGASLKAWNAKNRSLAVTTLISKTISTVSNGMGSFTFTYSPATQIPFLEIPSSNGNVTIIPVEYQSNFNPSGPSDGGNDYNNNSMSGNSSMPSFNTTMINDIMAQIANISVEFVNTTTGFKFVLRNTTVSVFLQTSPKPAM